MVMRYRELEPFKRTVEAEPQGGGEREVKNFRV